MIIPVAGLLAVLSPALAGGRLRRFADLRLRQAWVPMLALLAQIVVIEVVPAADQVSLAAVHVCTYAAAGWFVWLNREVPGLWLVAVGAASNGLTIALNGGTLPASAGALRTAGITSTPGEFVNSGVVSDARLPLLGDVFAIPASWPLANVFSVGDVLIVAGVAWGAHRICGSRLTPRLTGNLKAAGASGDNLREPQPAEAGGPA